MRVQAAALNTITNRHIREYSGQGVPIAITAAWLQQLATAAPMREKHSSTRALRPWP